jgi:hypothetical protein
MFLAMDKIAILVSTSPLRKTTTRNGVTKQRLNFDVCLELARKFDVVVIGSLSSDEVFEYIERHLTPVMRPRFRLYPRTFFHTLQVTDPKKATDDPRNVGWQQILSENGIEYETLRSRIGRDNRSNTQKFAWDRLTDFITDSRVALVSGSEGQLLFDTPVAATR